MSPLAGLIINSGRRNFFPTNRDGSGPNRPGAKNLGVWPEAGRAARTSTGWVVVSAMNMRFSTSERETGLADRLAASPVGSRRYAVKAIWRTVQDQQLYIPIHHQVLNWGMAEGVGIEVDPEDQPKVKYITMN